MRWRNIKEYEGFYQVSDEGLVRSFHIHPEGFILKPIINNRGYCQVVLHLHGNKKHYFIHRLVGKSFLPEPRKDRIQINHKDGDPHNNHLSNLEWCTQVENIYHKIYVLGRDIGENSAHAKKYEITFPDGHKEIIIGMRAFCRKHDLHSGNMVDVSNGKYKQHKNFKVRRINK